ncbi:MAG: hypothetical protein IPK50_22825 [Fibrobacterota bacterium]|nr:MAG: hypothetical protein IPK50_22825 [Fibrobacterota bacterium]
MAAKEESVILKYLKKNPGSEALDVSFGTDIDESVVKETLQQLLGKQQVSQSVSDSGISTWNIATPPPPAPKPVAPKPVATPKPAREDAPVEDVVVSDSDLAPSSNGGGTGKGFVILIALLFAAISAGATFYLLQSTIKTAETKLITDNKRVLDSLSTVIQATNVKISGLQVELNALKPPAEEKVEDKAKGKPAAKVAPKKTKKGK